jgi:Rrf2 family protein
MKINTKTRYGIRTMIELAMDWNGKGLFQKDISERQEISYKYLDHIIAALKAKGLIVNVEGRKSGYKLGRKPESISVYDIFTAFEPNLSVVDGLNDEGKCVHTRSCAAEDLWWGLNRVILDYLRSSNLKQLADKQIQYINENESNNFVI